MASFPPDSYWAAQCKGLTPSKEREQCAVEILTALERMHADKKDFKSLDCAAIIQEQDLVAGGAIVSIVCCSLVIGLYFRFKKLRRPPVGIWFRKTIWDLLLSVLILYAARQPRIECVGAPTPNFCHAGRRGPATAFFTQFFLVGSEMWFLSLSVDLYSSIRNPFSEFKTNRWAYYFLVCFVGLVSATILVTGHVEVDPHRPGRGMEPAYGKYLLPFCWVNYRITESSLTSTNPYLAIFAVPFLFAYAIAAAVSVFVGAFLGAGDVEDIKILRQRANVIRDNQRFLFLHGVTWAVVLSLWFAYVRRAKQQQHATAGHPPLLCGA